MGGAVFLTEAW